MSEISTRPKVKSVVNARTAGATRNLADVLIFSAVAIGAVCIKALSKTANAQTAETRNLESIASLRDKFWQSQKTNLEKLTQSQNVNRLEAMKGSSLAALAETPYVVEDSASFKAELKTLDTSKSVEEVVRSQRALLEVIESSHQRVFTNSIKVACSNALQKIGFSAVQVLPYDFSEKIRLAATDPGGRTLITEISTSPESDTSIATEFVGSCDGRAQAILDAFEEALEGEGVRASSPVRKPTGGVCQLDSTRKFVRQKAWPGQNSSTVSGDDQVSAQRRQNLNQRNRQFQR